MRPKDKISPSELQTLGYLHPDLLKTAKKSAQKILQKRLLDKVELLSFLKDILENPSAYLGHPFFERLAQKVLEVGELNQAIQENLQAYELKSEVPEYPVFGKEGIESSALEQMDTALRLPIAEAGALMPDAHHGYGLPIGGVLATQGDKVIPFAVGVDIACRMCLSVFELEASYLEKNRSKLKRLLQKNTCFGTGKGFENPEDDELFEKPEWRSTKLIRDLRKKARAQVGSSGTGNHFVEWGFLEVSTFQADIDLEPGQYLALLSHSGSRGFGANIAAHYSKLAMEESQLPDSAKHLAWLDMNQEAGQEYWLAMQLAGEYAAANHDHIHRKMARDLGLKAQLRVENHHNFAWKEKLANGQEVIIHRKGATPAKLGELGIIPGSMSQAGYLVRGKGNAQSLFSASHGAGRVLSRAQARKKLVLEDWQRHLHEQGIILLGGDIDESPKVYKDIEQVMAYQRELVDTLAKFTPKIVRMADKEVRRKKRARFQET